MPTLDDLIQTFRTRRESTLREIEMIRSGALKTRTNGQDTTAWSLADARMRLSELERLITLHEARHA